MSLTAAEAKAANKADESYRWKVLWIVMIGTLMSALDSSIVNVSIPAIMADFGVGIDDVEWVVTGYMLAFATLIPITAWLRDKVGHKQLYVISLGVFTVGSVLCGLAWNIPTLIFARVIQAMGGGALTPIGMSMITESFDPSERGKALGYWAMGAIMGPAFGPTVGGYLTKYFGWPSIFLVNLPIGLIGIYFASRILKADRPHAQNTRPFDVSGFVFLAIFLVSFLLGMSKGEVKGWDSSYVVTCGIIAVLSLIGFLLVESLTTHGIINLALLKNPVFSACLVMTGARSVALFGGVFLLPVFLQNYRGLDEVESGLLLLPGSLFMGLLMPITGRLGDKVSPRVMAFFGFLFMGLFFYQYRYLDVTTSNWGIVGPTMLRGIGVALLIAPLTATAMNAVPKSQTGMASSMINLMQQIGGSIGIAILSLVLSNRISYHMNLAGTAVTRDSDAYKHIVRALYWRAHDLGASHGDAMLKANVVVGRYVGQTAGVEAFQDAFLAGSVIVFITMLGVFLLPSKPPRHGGGIEAAVME